MDIPTQAHSGEHQDVVQLRPFSAADDEHRALRLRCATMCAAFNAQPMSTSKEEKARAWNAIVDPDALDTAAASVAPMIKPPVTVDYGLRLRIAPSVFINKNCFIGDTPHAEMTIGGDTLIGPGVHILGVTHDVDWKERRGTQGPSLYGPVKIGSNVFIGSYVVILPGVTIGDGCVIGASSVVTRSIPAFHVAVGNPARPIRKVALGVPDAPGLRYHQTGDRTLVLSKSVSQDDMGEDSTRVGSDSVKMGRSIHESPGSEQGQRPGNDSLHTVGGNEPTAFPMEIMLELALLTLLVMLRFWRGISFCESE